MRPLLLGLFGVLASACGGQECGDGVVSDQEQCDLGSGNADEGSCKLDCTIQSCGDGVVGAGEGCDPAADESCECSMSWSRTLQDVRTGNDLAAGPDGRIALAGEPRDGASGIWFGQVDPQGDVLWTVQPEQGGAFSRSLAVAVAADGDVAVTGGTVLEAEDGLDLWVARHDGAGNERWRVTYAGAGTAADEGRAIAVDSEDDVVVLAMEGTEVLWIRAYGPTGAERWSETLRDMDDTPGTIGVAADDDGNIVMVASSLEDGHRDLRIRKYRADGSLVWSRFGNGAGVDGESDLAIDPAGNIVIAGAEGERLWIRKLDPDGDALWTRTFDGPPGTDVACDADGNILVTGSAPRGGDDHDLWVGRYDPDGTTLWTRTYHGAAAADFGARGTSIAADPDGNVLVAGQEFIEGRGTLLFVARYPP